MPSSPSDFVSDGAPSDDSALFPGPDAAGSAGQRLVTGALVGASFAITGGMVAVGYLASLARRWTPPSTSTIRLRTRSSHPRDLTHLPGGARSYGPTRGSTRDSTTEAAEPTERAISTSGPSPRSHLRSVP